MLTAYNYYEPEEENRVRKNLKDGPLFERELSLAERFSCCHPSGESYREACPMCAKASVHPFYEKWGVRYVRCADCGSIFADVAQADIKSFHDMAERKQLRLSEAYQDEAISSRSLMWQETLDWLCFRSYRYLGKNVGLTVFDVGERWHGFRNMLLSSSLCSSYKTFDSILENESGPLAEQGGGEKADLVLALDYMQQLYAPDDLLTFAKESLKSGGLFVVSTRLGTGLDTLLLKEKNRNVFPYEHILLPTREGIKAFLEKSGFEVLEFTTPGTFDVNFIKANLESLSGKEEFIRYFLLHSNAELEAEFQRIIQKAGLSSYSQVVARKAV